jgi:hypothetical protein
MLRTSRGVIAKELTITMNSSITQNVFQCSFDFPELHVVQPSLQRKCCTKCKETKTLDQFYKDRSGKDGYSPCCKQCKKAQLLERSLRNEDARELGLVEILSQKHCTQCGRLLPIEHFSKTVGVRMGDTVLAELVLTHTRKHAGLLK